jgi:diadenosine tetraphosphate (Ap4A) HIT family hydrolase
VTLDHLWAGWRSDYLDSGGADGPEAQAGPPAAAPDPASPVEAEKRCVFCRILASGEPDEVTNVVWRDPSGLVVAILNAYPYATGHLMVMPVRHTGDLETLGTDEAAALWAGVAKAVAAVKAAYRPDGLNVGINLGRAGGAGIPGHLHVHVVPRWDGDSNFMTSVAETRVLPEALGVTRQRLGQAWPD